MKNKLKSGLLVFSLTLGGAAFITGCGEKEDATTEEKLEEAGEKAKEAGEDAKDAMEDAAEGLTK